MANEDERAICPRCRRVKRGIHTCNPASERVQAYIACLQSAKALFAEMDENERDLVTEYTLYNLAEAGRGKG